MKATLTNSLRYASGEELLLLAVFRGTTMKRFVDRELDRRAMMRRASATMTANLAPAGSSRSEGERRLAA
jgi:hypothetical protein